ncbi:hypothetical protein HISP_00175 [Haloarcula hispanica N601]|uniref:Uncharacterized protein n=2 Tax=Haloarcula hispanica TaxID=51589 RepID=V5TR25_HALHI|nr:hypothetical protein HISP_00175 [Haloarcula hispanica N601]
MMRGGDIEDLSVNGRTDIFNHEEVRRYTNEKDGKIIKIEGEFEYKSAKFDFSISYAKESAVDMGHISVRKKGQRTGDVGIREEAFEFLEELYNHHFIEA